MLDRFRPVLVVPLLAAIGAAALGAHLLNVTSASPVARDPVAAAGARGWSWPNGLPGYRLGQREQSWNLARVREDDLVPARRRAADAGIGSDLRVLDATRQTAAEATVIVAGRSHASTCLSFVIASSATPFFCPSAVGPQRLGSQLGFVVTQAKPFAIGVARGDVTKVVLHAAGFEQLVYGRGANATWGTFTTAYGPGYGPRGAKIGAERLDFYGARGLLASLPLTPRQARPQLHVVARSDA